MLLAAERRMRERAAGNEHRFFALGIDLRWREIAFLAAALGPLAYLAAALGLREREREREETRKRKHVACY